MTLASWNKSYDKPRQHIKKQRYYFVRKGLYSQSYGFSNIHVWMWELIHREGWVPKNECFQTVVLEKILESPLDCNEIKPVSPKGNQPWIFNGNANAGAEAPIVWPLDGKSIEKDPDVGKDWRQEEKGTTEDEVVVKHHWLNRYEFEQTPEDGEGQGRLTYYSPWGRRIRHNRVTEQPPISSFLAPVWGHWMTLNHKSWYDGLMWNSCY